MSVLNENTIIGASAAGEYEIDHSLRLHNRGGDGASTGKTLRRTPSVNSNRRTWTLSMWHKRGDLNHVQIQDLFFGTGAGGGGDGVVRLRFERGLYATKDKLWLSLDGAATVNAVTNQLFRDASAWMHIVLRFDTTQSTATDRARIYINGEVISSTDYSFLWGSSWSNLAQNSEWAVNKAGWYESFAGTGSTSNPDNVLGGYLADIAFVDGQSLGPDSFGETGDYGEWKPIDVSDLTFGTNGYHLDFADASAMGNDANGSNNFSVYNITANDQMVDSPTNNFATFNPIHDDTTGTSTEVFSQGNLRVGESGTGWSNIFGSQGMPSGKWYWEAYMVGSGTVDCIIGIAKTNWHRGTDGGIDTAGAYSIYTASDGNLYSFNSGSSTNEGSGVAFTWGDILQVAYDADTGKLWFGKNNTWLFSGNPSTGSTPKMTVGASDTGNMLPAWSQYHAANAWAVNFGSDSSFSGVKTPQGNQDSNDIGDFFYAPPTGFLSLCTKSLPDVDVIPSEHFNTVLYTGNSSTQSITGVGFQPDFSWFKERSPTTGNHSVFDVVRGATKMVAPDLTSVEETQTGVTAFDADGFTLGSWPGANKNGSSIVAWNWKAGGAAVSNSNGSITSSVSANPSAGFSIVSYTGNGTAGATVGHGLSSAPEMMIIKSRSDGAVDWGVYHTALGPTKWVRLNLTSASATASNVWNNTAPTSSVFSLGSGGHLNGSSDTEIAYCFHSVDGYSKIGSYKGTTVNAGSFVHTGFKVAFVLIKTMFDGDPWVMMDAARDPYNVATKRLRSDSSAAETTDAQLTCDFLSNGFKPYGNSYHINGNGQTYLYIAFAESPFKHTNAR